MEKTNRTESQISRSSNPALHEKQGLNQVKPPPNIPRHTPPQHGILPILPAPWVPYAESMRLEKPAGLYAFYFPYLIGLCYAACIADEPPSLEHVVFLGGLFLVGSVILRGGACAWNDNIDQDFDRKTTRCCLWPIARGAVSTTQGHLFTRALTIAGLPLFVLLPFECINHAVPITILFAFYPFAKRVTYYPQVVLGFPFAWAIFMCCAALGVDPFGSRSRVPTACLFAANILWTIIYDTIYAHQDIKDNVKAGVKSMAVRFANNTNLLVTVLASVLLALLVLTGWEAELSSIYFVGSCGGALISLASMIAQVELAKPASLCLVVPLGVLVRWWKCYGRSLRFICGEVSAFRCREHVKLISVSCKADKPRILIVYASW